MIFYGLYHGKLSSKPSFTTIWVPFFVWGHFFHSHRTASRKSKKIVVTKTRPYPEEIGFGIGGLGVFSFSPGDVGNKKRGSCPNITRITSLSVGFSGTPKNGTPYPYYSHTTPIRIPKDMGMVWEAYHKGVPLLGVPGISLDCIIFSLSFVEGVDLRKKTENQFPQDFTCLTLNVSNGNA